MARPARITAQPIPHAANSGRCYVCFHPAGEGEMADTGQTIDYEGTLVICVGCIKVWAGQLGFADPEKAEELRATNRRLGGEVARLRKALDTLDDAEVAIMELATALRDAE